ncbi:MAG: hypothetical protein HOE90_24785 [Bacteriovoracaceae bacterium]|jgi:lipoyl(octanoyl) transferase|nr:hypothetical protein [Bacteriovoracaceae bacterium]
MKNPNYTDFFQQHFSHLEDVEISELGDSRYAIEAWNKPYDQILDLQEKSAQFVYDHPQTKVYIFCSHPHCFTNGRGLQKSRNSEDLKELKPFDQNQEKLLSLPLYQIFRGGGLTFHHPGQWIFYPITKLNTTDHTLSKHIDWVLDSTAKTIKKCFDISVDISKKPLGLWKNQRKVGSLGVGSKRYVTIHGLALNIEIDQKMKDALRHLNPCGLSSDTYCSISEMGGAAAQERLFTETFKKNFLK